MEIQKRAVTNTASAAIIYRATDPRQLFIEVKDDGHPVKLVRRQLCAIGGNWIGPAAADDKSPLDTMRRELDEELSLNRPMRSSLELEHLGMAGPGDFIPTPISDVPVTELDVASLELLKQELLGRCYPIFCCLNTVSVEALLAADPDNKRPSFSALISYFEVPVSEFGWASLVDLHGRYGNLSNEAVTLVTTIEEIIERGTQFAFGHDRGYRLFYQSCGLGELAEQIPSVPGVSGETVGAVLSSYAAMLERYDIARKP